MGKLNGLPICGSLERLRLAPIGSSGTWFSGKVTCFIVVLDRCLIMLNRGVLLVRPAQPFIDWAASLDDSGVLPTVDGEQTVYLVPEFGYEFEKRAILEEVFAEVFASELFGWHTDESVWPQSRTLKMFHEWFSIEMHSVVEDLCDYPLEDDDAEIED
jgi:hypothetical protein